MRARDAGKFLRAFADGTRLRIIHALSDGELSVSSLAHVLKCPGKRVSRHLQYLAARGVVESANMGQGIVYRLRSPTHTLHRIILSSLQACRDLIDEGKGDRSRAARRRPSGG